MLRFLAILLALAAPGAAPARSSPPDAVSVVVGHGAATGLWLGHGRASDGGLELAVLQRCQQAMGTGCFVMRRVTRGLFVVARNENGSLWVMDAEDEAVARREVMAACRKPAFDCGVERVSPLRAPGPQPVFEDPTDSDRAPSRLGVIVWHALSTGGWRLFVATGRQSMDLAAKDGIANCTRAAGGGCFLLATGVGTQFIVFTDQNGRLLVKQGRTLAEAEARWQTFCRAQNLQCRLHFVADAKLEETSEYRVLP